MITKILIEILKRNKVQLKYATTGDNFRLAVCFEFILSIFTTVVGSILVSNSNTHIMIFAIFILIYSMGSMISFFSVFFTLKSLWEWNSELTSKYYSTGTVTIENLLHGNNSCLKQEKFLIKEEEKTTNQILDLLLRYPIFLSDTKINSTPAYVYSHTYPASPNNVMKTIGYLLDFIEFNNNI